jgi:hypothetical protein
MDITTTEVYKYFYCIEKYAWGDLYLLQQLANKAEEQEKKQYGRSDNQIAQQEPPQYSPGSGSYSTNPPFEPICRATIPFALMVFSCIDVLGYLVKQNGSHRRTRENITEFFKHIEDGPSSLELDCLINIYRHGLAHNYFPKLNQAISYHTTNPDKLFFKCNGKVVLNVNKLESLFMAGFSRIRGEVNLYAHMELRFLQLTISYQEEDSWLLPNLPD